MAVNIMIQGTMSNAGKSLIAAGLCRVFAQDGYRVAPFKSQNMALNSYVTEEGLEMGRAQVVQAEACGRKPSVLMNPVLLKPTTDVGSQVIVMGRMRSNMKAGDYFKYKKSLIPEIMDAYQRLAADNDIIVIEGAGSPAEINLKADDIVNMGLAKMVDAPVLLVGDIDRGGVFAQLAGTVMLLEEEERDRIKGMIINKFRGDVSILKPGLKMIEEICRKPVIGVVPYERLDIEDEDSLSERLENRVNYERGNRKTQPEEGSAEGREFLSEEERKRLQSCLRDETTAGFKAGQADGRSGNLEIRRNDCEADGENARRRSASDWKEKQGFIDIAVVRLPRISNFTDFAALEAVDGARVRYADAPSELADADVIVLPGTKSTMSDLAWLRRTGLAEQIVRRGRSGAVVIGICGGYQMLGNTITDRSCTESEHPVTAAALGLLPVDTVFQKEKTLGLTSGIIADVQEPLNLLAGLPVSGYEIHMGTSVIDENYSDQCRPLVILDRKDDHHGHSISEISSFQPESEHTDGCILGTIMGTYLHGIFDSSRFTEALLTAAAQQKGLEPDSFRVPDRQKYKEMQYDKLADLIRNSIDIKKIYSIMGI